MDLSWLMGLLGGLVIGAAAAMFLLVNGRIMGISGILGGLVDGTGRGNWPERAAFIAGLVAVPAVLGWLWGATTHLTGTLLVIIAGGLLVGVDTQVVHGFLNCGAVGAITGIGNALPTEVLHLVALCRAAAQGDPVAERRARELDHALHVLSSFDEGVDLVLHYKYHYIAI